MQNFLNAADFAPSDGSRDGVYRLGASHPKNDIGAPDCTVRLTIAALTTLLHGYKTAVQLWRLGRIAAELAVAARLDDALLHEAPYISDYI